MSQPIIGISGNHYKTGDHTEPLLSYTQTCLVNAIEDGKRPITRYIEKGSKALSTLEPFSIYKLS
ncbi:MAG: hypothetical protein WAV75_03985 [Streptococcus suis]